MRKESAHRHRHGKFRSRSDVRCNSKRLSRIFVGEFLCKLEYAELTADADILLDIRCCHTSRALRKVLQHLFCFYGNLVKVRTRMLGKKCRRIRIDLQSP